MNLVIPYITYPFEVMFSFAESDRELAAQLKPRYISHAMLREGWHRYRPGDVGIYAFYANGFALVRLPVVPKTPEDYGVLQHEIFHVVVCLLKHVGMSLTDESVESYTYLIQYLTKEVYARLQT